MKVRVCLLDFPLRWAPDEGFGASMRGGVDPRGRHRQREGEKYDMRWMAVGLLTGLDARWAQFGCGGRVVA